MKKGRSTFTFQLNCDPISVNNIIESFLEAKKFTLISKNGEEMYRAGDAMIEGYRYFSYTISGQTLTIYAWFQGAFKRDIPIERNNLNITSMNYRNSLNSLFQEISKLNNHTNSDLSTAQPINQNNYQQPVQNHANQAAQKFQDETTKKQETMCEIGFWISLFGVFCAFMGVMYGVIIYILNFYFASQGLKTRKKGKAIATIVLSIVSILMIVFQLMLY